MSESIYQKHLRYIFEGLAGDADMAEREARRSADKANIREFNQMAAARRDASEAVRALWEKRRGER